MSKFIKIIKRLILVVLLVFVVFIISTATFVGCAPQFGEAPKGDHLSLISQSKNYGEDSFKNEKEVEFNTGEDSFFKTMVKWITAEGTVPQDSLPVKFSKEQSSDTSTYITWFGHSAVLLEIDGLKVLIDPMLGDHASPMSLFANRFTNTKAPFELDSLGNIDVIIISHDHYDHLDYETIIKLADKTDQFIVPLGISSHLIKWNISKEKITELDWFEFKQYKSLTITAAPAQHFSGRGLRDRNATLWASWAVKGKSKNIFFSGDGGYGDHFKTIGQKLGPFDLAMMECGQYNENWAQIHCMPEESVQASLDVKGKKMMPIHWGAFDLSIHTWKEPITRALKAADSLNVKIITPNLGFKFSLDNASNSSSTWWETLK